MVWNCQPAEEPAVGSEQILRTKRAKSVERHSKPGRIHAVLTTLGREIAQGVIPAGAVLPPEHELEIRLGVGRGVVREAIKTLSGKGLVSVRPRHGTRVLPRSDWSLLDRDVLNWLVGKEKPDRELLLAIQEVRSIIEPAAAALAATRATKKDRQRINAALEAMETSDNQASATAADKAFHLAILDATHNPVLQGFRGAIDTILSAVFVVAVDSVGGWFDGNLPNHVITARAIEEGDAKKARDAMEQVIGYTQSKLSKLDVGAGHRNGRLRSPRDQRQT
jgi:GntR family transcriptional regulator, galactonate operon transcriptional repressor